jgi:hypothetical protein
MIDRLFRRVFGRVAYFWVLDHRGTLIKLTVGAILVVLAAMFWLV